MPPTELQSTRYEVSATAEVGRGLLEHGRYTANSGLQPATTCPDWVDWCVVGPGEECSDVDHDSGLGPAFCRGENLLMGADL
jgi:hypothetical protein